MSPLPDFEEPPVVEVAISLQFKPFESLRSPQFGLLWNTFRREGYTRIEEHGELEAAFEEFEVAPNPKVGIKLQAFDDPPPPPRLWFLNETQVELIQVQRDRLIVNWRRGAQSDAYPRYPKIMGRFRSALESFAAFTTSEKLGAILPTQCEVTYVNHLPSGKGWWNHGELERVITTWQSQYSDDYLPMPEDVRFQARYRMNDDAQRPLGRLHVIVEPAYTSVDHHPIFVMNLTGRGKPDPADLEGAFRLFDYEHEWIVRGFTSMTTKNMHQQWRRRNG